MAVRDKRLPGGVPSRANLAIHNTDASTPLRGLFNHVRLYAGAGKINSAFVLCHGYAGANKALNLSMDAGGMGLQLGQEGLRHSNVAEWTQIKNKVTNIIVYACAAADTQPGNENTKADGKYLMGALALHTNANVYAADKIQWYFTYRGMPTGAFNFGAWDGQLFMFSGSTGRGVPVPSVPVEFTDVLNGTAP
jgi:uncharacterized protein YycO